MQPSNLEIEGVHCLINAVEKASNFFRSELWWRGQAQSWLLLPGIYRKGVCRPKYTEQCERDMCGRFLVGAQQRHTKWTDLDPPHTLATMQHYGLPTRLLDWTESPFFALLFSLLDSKLDSNDGILWALSPSHINQVEFGKTSLLSPYTNPKIMSLFKAPFGVPGKKHPPIKNAAVMLKQVDIRMTVQLCGFTIHGRATPLDKAPKADNYLMAFSIPKDCKEALRSALFRLAIRDSNIFPDLEHLAREIREWGAKEDYSAKASGGG